MSTSIGIGCTSCGQILTIASPDSVHTEAHRMTRMGVDWPDYIFMNAKCTKCGSSNFIYWYRPLNYWYRPS